MRNLAERKSCWDPISASTPVDNVIKVTTLVTYGRKVSLTAINSVLKVIKHFYGCILRQQTHLAA